MFRFIGVVTGIVKRGETAAQEWCLYVRYMYKALYHTLLGLFIISLVLTILPHRHAWELWSLFVDY